MRNRQGTEEQSLPQAECSHVPLNPTHPPTHTLARSCLCDWKVIAEALGPRKKGLGLQSARTQVPRSGYMTGLSQPQKKRQTPPGTHPHQGL